jgi:hypothetical protein
MKIFTAAWDREKERKRRKAMINELQFINEGYRGDFCKIKKGYGAF